MKACRLAVAICIGATLWPSVATGRPPTMAAHGKPPDRSRRTQVGPASFYGHREAGRTTASGRPLRLDHMTAASPTLPIGTRARVVNRETGKAAQVTITGRGPYAKGRVLDVTPRAARQLGISKEKGVAPVAVKPISEPPPPGK